VFGLRRAWLVGVMLGVAACTADPPDLEPESGSSPPAAERATLTAPISIPGDLLLVEGRLRFQPCGQTGAQPVDDGTGGEAFQAIQQLGYGEDRVRVAVVMDAARLVEIRTATPERARCEDLIRDVVAEAMGNEPFWLARIKGVEARWITPEDQEGSIYSGGSWRAAERGELVYEARRDGVDGVEFLRVRLTEQRCLDTMSGQWFPFSARAEEGGRTYRGCALEGRRAFGGP